MYIFQKKREYQSIIPDCQTEYSTQSQSERDDHENSQTI